MRKYLSRILFFIVILIILLVSIFFYYASSLLDSHKVVIEEALSRYFQKRVTIQTVRYQPFKSILLENIAIFKTDASGYNQLLSIENATLTLSLIELIKNKEFVLTAVYLNKPTSRFIDYKYFSKAGLDKLIGIINSLLRNQSLNIVIQDAILPLYEQEKLSDYFIVDSKIDIRKQGIVSSKGSIDLIISTNTEYSKKSKLDYNFSGNFTKNGVVIDNLEVQKENLYLRSWGALSNDFFRLSGSIFTVKPVGIYSLHQPKFIDKIKKVFGFKRKSAIEIIVPTKSILNIFDLGCLIRFVPDGLSIENLSLSLEDIPLRLKGEIMFLKPLKVNLQISSFPNQAQSERLQNPKRFDLEIDGDLQDNRFNGRLSLDFLAAIKAKKSQETIEANLKNLTFYPVDDNRLGLNLKEANISCLANNNLYNILLEDFNALIGIEKKSTASIEFFSGLFDGSLKGNGSINIERIPFRSSFQLSLEDISANKLSPALVYLSKVYGKLSSEISYRNYPNANLEGNFSISEGYLDNLRFFGWLSDFFSMSALKKLDFNKIYANFLVNDEVTGLRDIVLDSSQLSLKGYFNIFANDLVSGNLSLIFSEQLLDTSLKFKKLLKLLGKDASAVNFDFQMSGLYETMNFKWLESDFKDSLQKLLPARMERNLEQRIEDAIANISTDKEVKDERLGQ